MARRGGFGRVVVVAAVVAVAVAAACSSNNNCTSVLGPGQTLVGNYTLLSFAQGGQTVPGVTGQLRLHDTTYYVTLQNIPLVGTVTDSGSYALSCPNGISQKSVFPGGPQLVGTFTVNGTTLSVTGTVSGIAQSTTWQKQ